MTLVKICGVRDVATALVAAEAGADFIGLMFAESRRQVSPQVTHDIVTAVREHRKSPGRTKIDGPARGDVSGRTWFAAWAEAIEDSLPLARPLIAGVFADQDTSIVSRIAYAAELDLVQLSGGEAFDVARELDEPVINAVHVGDDSALDVSDRIEPGDAVAVLLDTKVAGARGGTGVAFDWNIAAEVGERLPVMLAGGLTPDNVGEAIATAHPWAVDVSSGVETNGRKDHDKIRAFIRAAKGSER